MRYYDIFCLKICDQTYQTSEYQYDVMGNPIAVIGYDGTGQNVVRYEYDKGSRLTKMITGLSSYEMTADGAVTQYEYDILGRKIKETDPIGQTVSYEYDRNGNIVRYTDRNGTVTETSYHDFGSPKQITAKNGAVTQEKGYQYDGFGRMVYAQFVQNGIVTDSKAIHV
jgi:YD repeat-containing protein